MPPALKEAPVHPLLKGYALGTQTTISIISFMKEVVKNGATIKEIKWTISRTEVTLITLTGTLRKYKPSVASFKLPIGQRVGRIDL